ncbi:ketose-bisphosphate aldolase [Brachyspira alvinipulli]|uniref:ketose-bisphosphate aldolase n=1 Tax=Brachyspira alvinipulli TaxID=84379 RepID=UPI00260CF708|nr:ketose-bisphosphate aldolase [uncultured Brachyspira sp.]
MSLVMMKKLVNEASKNKTAVGAFNIANMEILIGVIKAAEETNTPIIIQTAEKRLKYSPLNMIFPMMVNAAKKSKVDIAVQLDHGYSMDIIKEAADCGVTSIMYDGSHLPLKENIKNTNELYNFLKNKNINLEAEIGVLSGDEGNGEMKEICTDVNEAKYFYENASFDALAVSIGNAHGHYKGVPKLNFEVLKTLHEIIETPLVLHGGTGISEDDFKKSISFGISKINVATANFDALVRASSNYFSTNKSFDYFSLNECIIEEVFKTTANYINIFNNK